MKDEEEVDCEEQVVEDSHRSLMMVCDWFTTGTLIRRNAKSRGHPTALYPRNLYGCADEAAREGLQELRGDHYGGPPIVVRGLYMDEVSRRWNGHQDPKESPQTQMIDAGSTAPATSHNPRGIAQTGIRAGSDNTKRTGRFRPVLFNRR